jgi:cell division protein FtsW (lipid II flippase)
VAQTGNLTRDFPVKYVCILSFYQILMFAQLDSATPHAIVFVFFFILIFENFQFMLITFIMISLVLFFSDMLFKVFLREERRMRMLIGILLNGQADDEYDFEDGPRSKSHKKGRDSDHKVSEKNDLAKRILTQQERRHFIFENPNRPKHLVVSIANFTYLMLPQWRPVVPGHCCILPMQVSLV